MKRSMGLWQFAGFAVTVLFGTLLHFLYDFTGESLLAAPFSAVNESTWEHMKLLFFPMLVFALIEARRLRGDYPTFWCVKLRGVLVGMGLIPVLFYTWSGAFGQPPAWLNIAFFFLCAGVAFAYEARRLRQGGAATGREKRCLACLLLLALLFVLFTFLPPHLPLFRDPITGGYGIRN